MGLNKPIIITSSAVDTSNLASKSDMTALQNAVTSSLANAGGAVKSVQRGTIGYNFTGKTVSGTLMGNAGYDSVFDVTISSVNTSKTIVDLHRPDSASQLPVLLNSTTLRIYVNNRSSSSNSLSMSSSMAWQVIEYK